jgi:hypothetical protein
MATLDRLAPPVAALPREGTWTPRRAIAAAVITVVAIALLQVFQSGTFANTGANMQRLEEERVQTLARIHDLEAETAALASLDRTERAARERLGMVPATKFEYVRVDVAAPSVPLLPRPLTQLEERIEDNRAWWEKLLQALPFR